jgi:hypothetical protein
VSDIVSWPGPPQPEPEPEPARARRRRRAARSVGGDLRAGLIFLGALVLAGPLLGLLWAALAPRLDVAAATGGSETAFTAQADIDATFGFICLGAGVLAGALARWRSPDGGWPVATGLAGGGLAGSLLAGWVGHAVRSPSAVHQLPPDASSYLVGLVEMRVRSHGLYLVLPAVALLVLALSLWLPNGWSQPNQPGDTGALAPDELFAAATGFRPVPASSAGDPAPPVTQPPPDPGQPPPDRQATWND